MASRFGKIAAVGLCLVAASLQVYARDLPAPVSQGSNSTVDVPTVIPRVIPIEVDLDDEIIMKSSDASLASPTYFNLDQQIETISQTSDLVFHGQITDVEYSEAAMNTEGRYPLTYITFFIFEILQGTYDAKEIVLMMAGVGYIPPDTFASNSDLPILAKGDEVVIFLAQGTVNGPYYVHHFFVEGGAIYDSESHEIVKGDHDSIWRGSFNPKPKILERPLGVGTMHFVQGHSDNADSVAPPNKKSFRTTP